MRLTSRFKLDGRRAAAARLSPLWSAVVVVVSLLLIFELDRRTASAPFQHLYYLPIIFAGMTFRVRGSLLAALAAIVLYHLANPYLLTFRYGQADLVQICLFLGVGLTTAKLTYDARRLHLLAMTDDLTGLHNLRSFEACLPALIQQSRAQGLSLSMLVFDVDRLKSLNDQHGHLAGAEAVRTVGHLVAARLPEDAVASRYGGDEFVVAIPSCPPFRARQIANDLCRTVSDTAPVLAGIAFPTGTISISVGIATCVFDLETQTRSRNSDEDLGGSLFRAADAALYRAKEQGRNQVCGA
jgi:diguanylate cyclase (GGDEF)-like protein